VVAPETPLPRETLAELRTIDALAGVLAGTAYTSDAGSLRYDELVVRSTRISDEQACVVLL
jgi:hypothetical protein